MNAPEISPNGYPKIHSSLFPPGRLQFAQLPPNSAMEAKAVNQAVPFW